MATNAGNSDGKVILVDLGGVVAQYGDRYQVVRQIIEGYQGDPYNFLDQYCAKNRTDFYKFLNEGRDALRDFYSAMQKTTGIPVSYHEFFALYSNHLRVIDGVARLLKDLSEKHEIVPVSDGDASNETVVDALTCFYRIKIRYAFMSYREGCIKPTLYCRAVKVLQIAEEQCVIIDDTDVFLEWLKKKWSTKPKYIHFDGIKQSAQDLLLALNRAGIYV